MSYRHKLAIQLESEKFLIISRINKLSTGLSYENVALIIAPLNSTNEDFKVHVCDSREFKILGYLIVTSAALVHFKTCQELMQYQKIFTSVCTQNPLQLLKASIDMGNLTTNPLRSLTPKNDVTELFNAKWSDELKEEKFKKAIEVNLKQELKSAMYEIPSLKSLDAQLAEELSYTKKRLRNGESKKNVREVDSGNVGIEQPSEKNEQKLQQTSKDKTKAETEAEADKKSLEQSLGTNDDVKVLFLSSDFNKDSFLGNSFIADHQLNSTDTKTKDEESEYVVIICDAEKYLNTQTETDINAMQEIISETLQHTSINEKSYKDHSTEIDQDFDKIFTTELEHSSSESSTKTLCETTIKKCRFDGCTQTEEGGENQTNFRFVASETLTNVPKHIFSHLKTNVISPVSLSIDSFYDQAEKQQNNIGISTKHVQWASSDVETSENNSKADSIDGLKGKLNPDNLSFGKNSQFSAFDANFYRYKLSKIFSESSNDYVLGVFTAASDSLDVD